MGRGMHGVSSEDEIILRLQSGRKVFLQAQGIEAHP